MEKMTAVLAVTYNRVNLLRENIFDKIYLWIIDRILKIIFKQGEENERI